MPPRNATRPKEIDEGPVGLTLCPMAQGADLTGLLQQWSRGDATALEQLAPLVQRDLRDLARRLLGQERRTGRLQPTELVHEAYLRLLDWRSVRWQNRAHFFATTTRMMRRILVSAARARQAEKRGPGADVLPFEEKHGAPLTRPVDIVALADALDALATMNPRPAHVVELRFFGGFSVEETAEALDVSVRTVINDWNTARAWLRGELTRQGRHGL
jgi:RNA polymerase sigma-70 factor, ECF subfamily